MNAQQSQTFEVTTPNDRDVVMTRTFNADRARVFRAFTEPEFIKRWLLGPDGVSMPLCEVDLRPGGRFTIAGVSTTPAWSMALFGTFREVDAPARIVYREDHDEEGNQGDATVTTTFVEHNGLTTVTTTLCFDSRELRDKAMESGQVEGTRMCFDRLADIVLGA